MWGGSCFKSFKLIELHFAAPIKRMSALHLTTGVQFHLKYTIKTKSEFISVKFYHTSSMFPWAPLNISLQVNNWAKSHVNGRLIIINIKL